jgi:hypothetical protein
MRKVNDPVRSKRERGQTIILVAISLVSLLAMAALAIDVVTLYVARSEIQRAADAAALAGAKAIADSGITTLPTSDPAFSQAQTLAQGMANAAIAAALAAPYNQVAGATATPTITFQNFSTTVPVNNPSVTVSLQRTNLPTFFAHIWGRTLATVAASATAEAYNPANTASGTQFTPIAPKCVKPWLVANKDPDRFSPLAAFVTNGDVEAGAVGEQFDLTPDCPLCANTDNPPKSPSIGRLEFMAAAVAASPSNICPKCAGATAYEQSIACCDSNAYAYLNCGGGTNNAQWDSTVDLSGGPNSVCAAGADCLIHAPNPGWNQGQDVLENSAWPAGPPYTYAGGGTTKVSTSSSIVTIPIIDNSAPITSNVTIVGFLQGFINCVEDGTKKNCNLTGASTPGDINITILNVIGCSNNPSGATPVVGGNGASAIPVRLISP